LAKVLIDDQGINKKSGSVFTINNSYFCSYVTERAGSIFKLRIPVSGKVFEYQYTHVGPEKVSPLDAFPRAYVAAGIHLGNYGQYGATESSNLHLHLVNKVFTAIPNAHPCDTQQLVPQQGACAPQKPTDGCPAEPYLEVHY